MIEILYGVGLVASILIGYLAWKHHWKIADLL